MKIVGIFTLLSLNMNDGDVRRQKGGKLTQQQSAGIYVVALRHEISYSWTI